MSWDPNTAVHAVLLQRESAVARRIARVWRGCRLTVDVASSPEEVHEKIRATTALIGADEFDRGLIFDLLAKHPSMQGVLWTADPIERLLRSWAMQPQLLAVLGRPDFETTPAPWELAAIARRIVRPQDRFDIGHCLHYGFTHLSRMVRTTDDISAAVELTQQFASALDVPEWLRSGIADLAHELLMNAVYDAPIDADGSPRHAHDRKGVVALPTSDAAVFEVASDGLKLCVFVSDPFGRLDRRHLLEGLARGLIEGTLDAAGGGAGLGTTVIHKSSSVLVYDVSPSVRTNVAAFINLDLNRRTFRSEARSLHFFEHRPTEDA